MRKEIITAIDRDGIEVRIHNAGPVCIFGDHRWKGRIDYDSC